MSKVLIAGNPDFNRGLGHGTNLYVAEMFGDTIQGENFVGWVATFLRLQNCTLNCSWCDSMSVWRYGNPYTIEEICDIWEKEGFVEKFKAGQRLILTGGSPLKQQLELIELIELFIKRYGFKPYIEIENESVLPVHSQMIEYVDCWNNSPKLESSGNSLKARYKPEILKKLSSLVNAWFKFVVVDDDDWEEIKREFLDPGLIKKDQIVLMPMGATRQELELTRELTVNIAIRENVRFSDREHVIIWNKKTGI